MYVHKSLLKRDNVDILSNSEIANSIQKRSNNRANVVTKNRSSEKMAIKLQPILKEVCPQEI